MERLARLAAKGKPARVGQGAEKSYKWISANPFIDSHGLRTLREEPGISLTEQPSVGLALPP